MHEAVPVVKGTVRASLMECGYLMRQGKDEDGTLYTDVTYINSLDFKGQIPPSFINVILMQQPATLVEMRKLIVSEGKGRKTKGDCCIM